MNILTTAAAFRRRMNPALIQPVNWWKLQTDLTDTVNQTQAAGSGTLAFSTVLGRKAVRYNGSSYITLGRLSLNSQIGWSVSTWFNPVNFTGYAHLINSINTTLFGFKVAKDGDPSARRLYLFAAPSSISQVAPGDHLIAGRWYFLTATYDGAILRLYIGDKLVGQFTTAIGPISDTMRSGTGNAGKEFTNGYQSDLRIYDRALTPSEITAIMALPQ